VKRVAPAPHYRPGRTPPVRDDAAAVSCPGVPHRDRPPTPRRHPCPGRHPAPQSAGVRRRHAAPGPERPGHRRAGWAALRGAGGRVCSVPPAGWRTSACRRRRPPALPWPDNWGPTAASSWGPSTRRPPPPGGGRARRSTPCGGGGSRRAPPPPRTSPGAGAVRLLCPQRHGCCAPPMPPTPARPNSRRRHGPATRGLARHPGMTSHPP
jgi:hypothetical protein